MLNNKPSSMADLAMIASVFNKGEDLVRYYGKTNASAEFYYEDIRGYELKDIRLAVKILKACGAFDSVGLHDNVFDQHDPSLGWTGYNKPHAKKTEYYVTSQMKFKLFMLSYKHLYSTSWR